MEGNMRLVTALSVMAGVITALLYNAALAEGRAPPRKQGAAPTAPQRNAHQTSEQRNSISPQVTSVKHSDRVVVRDGPATWVIATTAAGVWDAGPGYIYRATLAGTVAIDDSQRGPGYINDPDYGGLGTFGFHLARKEGESFVFHADNAWPIDGRAANTRHGFGVTHAELVSAEDGRVVVMVKWGAPWNPTMATGVYDWRFANQKAHLRFTVRFSPTGIEYLKEPKLAFAASGVKEIRSKSSRWRGQLPRTGQSPPTNAPIRIGPIRVTPHLAWPTWANWARQRTPFGRIDSAGDHIVWDPGEPEQRWEFIRRSNGNGTVLLTGWEGGRGPYDAEPLSRIMVEETRRARVTVEFA